MESRLSARSRRNGRRREEGSALIEFLMSSIVWVPLLLGTIVFGINLVYGIRVSQLSRESGHMYAYGLDFAQSQNSPLLASLAASVNIKPNSGDGAILLSKVTLVTDTDCTAAGLAVCPNHGKYVFTSIFVFGNQTYAKSQLGNPSSGYYSNGTSITASQYLTDGSLVATNIADLFTDHTQSNQYAYISEVILNSQALTLSGFVNTGSYARSIF
jgi:hypothetical protein